MIGLEEVLRRGAASAVSSLRGAFTWHKHTRTTTVWTEFHSSLKPSRCAQDEAPLHHCSGVNQLHAFKFVPQNASNLILQKEKLQLSELLHT